MRNTDSNQLWKRKSPIAFFALVFLMSAFFWALGAVTKGASPEDTPLNLPVSSLMAVCPITAGVILVYRENGPDGVKRLLKSAFDYKGIKRKIWYLPIFLLTPMVMVLTNAFKGGTAAAPASQLPVLTVLIACLMIFVEALTEELGWQGYVYEPMQARWNALRASIILGMAWALWHTIPFIQMSQPADWIVWQSLNMVATRVIIVWIYNNTNRSVLTAILYHAMNNVSTMLFTSFGLIYDPMITTIILATIALTITFFWGPKTLAEYQYTQPGPHDQDLAGAMMAHARMIMHTHNRTGS